MYEKVEDGLHIKGKKGGWGPKEKFCQTIAAKFGGSGKEKKGDPNQSPKSRE